MSVIGADIPGENILLGTCRSLRERFGTSALPPLDMRLYKHVPMGSGVGAGSGNAAALIRWFERFSGESTDVSDAVAMGADVAFLASGYDIAMAGGVGDVLECISGGLDLAAAIFFPEWNCDTREAYKTLDSISGRIVTDEAECRDEALDVLDRLKRGERAGILPNDFIQCLKKHEMCYNILYGIFERSGALAWGLCGSGSACFALYGKSEITEVFARLSRFMREGETSRFNWITKVIFSQ
ncbi:MAG: 4-diphosphocytidyl-2C-methyl-D-erythritol kinase [Synergistaceae bacterium]|nr:4-diphosphocytidyl-2C-methyl-D-erythritol kinase [Synergistaceae bacterium]